VEGYGVGRGLKGVWLSIIVVADLTRGRGWGGCSGGFGVELDTRVIAECKYTRVTVHGRCLGGVVFKCGKMNLTGDVVGVGKLCLLREATVPVLIINGSSASFGE